MLPDAIKKTYAPCMAVLITVLISGCGGSDQKTTAFTSGKVVYEGAPVTGGELNFSPTSSDAKGAPGKPGFGRVKPDGSFSVSTYSENDGAVVGKSRVTYTAPPPKEISPMVMNPDGSHKPAVVEASPYEGLRAEPSEVDIKPGKNTLEIKLVK